MASRLVTKRYDRALAPAGLSTNAYSILARLDGEGPLSVGSLAARLAMDRSTLSREVEPLISAGLVSAAHDDSDRRRRILDLSSEGAARVSGARPLWAQAQLELAAEFGSARVDGLVGELRALVGAGE